MKIGFPVFENRKERKQLNERTKAHVITTLPGGGNYKSLTGG